jgi:HK97 family phage prohead protease
MLREVRHYAGTLAVERRGESQAPLIRGHAAVFDKLSENLGGFREVIAPGAFDDVLGDDVRALFNHDGSLILGRSSAGTLRIGVDAAGLTYEIDPPDTQYGRDLLVSLERGDVRESSFGFRVARGGDKWDESEDGVLIRTITRVSRLFDVSPVTFPAYPDTDSAKRTLQEYLQGRDLRAESQRRVAELRALELRRLTA